MSHARLENYLDEGGKLLSDGSPVSASLGGSRAVADDRLGSRAAPGVRPAGPQRTPRSSLIVVLADDQVVSPERVVERLSTAGSDGLVDVIVACAGQPTNLNALQRRVRDLQVLLAPVGTSREELRELAMKQSAGDIVTFLMGAPARVADRESLQTS